MPAYRDEKAGTWYVQCYYKDAAGHNRHKVKRGFPTELEAMLWEKEFLSDKQSAMDMEFRKFVKVYAEDVRPRLRESTWLSKERMIEDKILPFFGLKLMCMVQPVDIIKWQNSLTEHVDANGNHYKPTYLRTLNNQLNAIFNHAERYYGLEHNPVKRVGKMGGKTAEAMKFWTKDEYLRFSKAISDKPMSFYAFEVLYWTGIRCGELLALTPSDFELSSSTLSVTKSYQRLQRRDVVTPPKTPNSVRKVQMPKFLRDEMAEFIAMRSDLGPEDRLFDTTKYYLGHELRRGSEAAGVKRIRVHDLRHSHVSLLIDMGFGALAIAERVGHEAVDITYRYAHLFPTKQQDMANALDREKEN